MFACVASFTSRFGFVSRSVYLLGFAPVGPSGTELSFVNGLNHGLSSVRTHWFGWPATVSAPVMIRDLFFAEPSVIRIVFPTRSSGCGGSVLTRGRRPLESEPSTAG